MTHVITVFMSEYVKNPGIFKINQRRVDEVYETFHDLKKLKQEVI